MARKGRKGDAYREGGMPILRSGPGLTEGRKIGGEGREKRENTAKSKIARTDCGLMKMQAEIER